MFAPSRGHWRTVYALQVVHAQLLPPDDEDVTNAVGWRKQFLASGGFEHFLRFVMGLPTEELPTLPAVPAVAAAAAAAAAAGPGNSGYSAMAATVATVVAQRDTFTLPACLRSLSFLLAGAIEGGGGGAAAAGGGLHAGGGGGGVAAPDEPALRRQSSDHGSSVGGTSIPWLARQFSTDSGMRVVAGIEPAPLIAKVAALLRAAHAVHAPLHASPLLRGPQPGDEVLAEYMSVGGKHYTATVLALRPADTALDVRVRSLATTSTFLVFY